MSSSDLKHLNQLDWIDPAKGASTLLLFSIVNDHSGTTYQEYHCVYGEDAEAALRFLFNAMNAKVDPGFLFLGRPKMLSSTTTLLQRLVYSRMLCRRLISTGRHM